jgi:hypothetical protein
MHDTSQLRMWGLDGFDIDEMSVSQWNCTYYHKGINHKGSTPSPVRFPGERSITGVLLVSLLAVIVATSSVVGKMALYMNMELNFMNM